MSAVKRSPCLGLLFQVLHSQRHHEQLALGIAQTDDHKRGGHNDRPNRHQLAGAQTGIADQQRVGAQPLDQARPRPYQMI